MQFSHNLQVVCGICSQTNLSEAVPCIVVMNRLTERKMVRGKATYMGSFGRDVGSGSGSGKEDKGIFLLQDKQYCFQIFLCASCQLQEESAEMSAAMRSQISRKRNRNRWGGNGWQYVFKSLAVLSV